MHFFVQRCAAENTAFPQKRGCHARPGEKSAHHVWGRHTKRPPRRTERRGGRVPFFQFRYTMFSRMSLSATSAMNSLFVGFSVPM